MKWYEGFTRPIMDIVGIAGSLLGGGKHNPFVGQKKQDTYDERKRMLDNRQKQKEDAEKAREKSPSVPSSGQQKENTILAYVVLGIIALLGLSFLD